MPSAAGEGLAGADWETLWDKGFFAPSATKTASLTSDTSRAISAPGKASGMRACKLS